MASYSAKYSPATTASCLLICTSDFQLLATFCLAIFMYYYYVTYNCR